jgi:hypothetical protein
MSGSLWWSIKKQNGLDASKNKPKMERPSPCREAEQARRRRAAGEGEVE